MPSLKDLRGRIKSVKNTKQITKTMKMVAAAKMRKAENACEDARPYAAALRKVLHSIAAKTPKSGAPLLLKGRDEVKTVRLLVFGSSRGLCGGFNVQIIREVAEFVKNHEAQGQTVQLVTVGSKVYAGLKTEFNDHIVHRDDNAASVQEYTNAETLGQLTIDAFEEGLCDEVHILYNAFVNVMTQKPTFKQLIPFDAQTSDAAQSTQTNSSQDGAEVATTLQASPEYEPGEEQMLSTLLPLNVRTQIFAALLESGAAEQGARMTAMDNATRNAGEMISDLSLSYNRQRQAFITNEITEIVSGSESV